MYIIIAIIINIIVISCVFVNKSAIKTNHR